jgi:hypothetical protein
VAFRRISTGGIEEMVQKWRVARRERREQGFGFGKYAKLEVGN